MYIRQVNKSQWYYKSFQNHIYKLYKQSEIDRDWFYEILKIHYQAMIRIEVDGFEPKLYFDVCWKIIDKMKDKLKEMGKFKEYKKDIGKLYGFVTNRRREVLDNE